MVARQPFDDSAHSVFSTFQNPHRLHEVGESLENLRLGTGRPGLSTLLRQDTVTRFLPYQTNRRKGMTEDIYAALCCLEVPGGRA